MNEVVNPLSVDEIKCAEMEIVRCVQATSFREEVSCLDESKGDNATKRIKHNFIKKSSSIYSLDPQLQDGILRVGGHLKYAPIVQEKASIL